MHQLCIVVDPGSGRGTAVEMFFYVLKNIGGGSNRRKAYTRNCVSSRGGQIILWPSPLYWPLSSYYERMFVIS